MSDEQRLTLYSSKHAHAASGAHCVLKENHGKSGGEVGGVYPADEHGGAEK